MPFPTRPMTLGLALWLPSRSGGVFFMANGGVHDLTVGPYTLKPGDFTELQKGPNEAVFRIFYDGEHTVQMPEGPASLHTGLVADHEGFRAVDANDLQTDLGRAAVGCPRVVSEAEGTDDCREPARRSGPAWPGGSSAASRPRTSWSACSGAAGIQMFQTCARSRTPGTSGTCAWPRSPRRPCGWSGRGLRTAWRSSASFHWWQPCAASRARPSARSSSRRRR
ncbi:unnamed protein product [Prorocentrum cordatum]|uniref:Uncharacterized protein n=1 Tax=Prorocentrum cordatum TaxID=2364126 RepID=A0ABN9W2X9_9DINO|nr:unnamed protein product [Polarella glacialis]